MQRVLSVDSVFPSFTLDAVIDSSGDFEIVSDQDLNGQWSVIFFWPFDFTFVCPTELVRFNDAMDDFNDRDTKVYGISTDSKFAHLAWRNSHKDLQNLAYPMLADHKKHLSRALGILDQQQEVARRATFIVDPQKRIQWLTVNNHNVGRNVEEVIRTLDALQTEELCPCNWQKGEDTL